MSGLLGRKDAGKRTERSRHEVETRVLDESSPLASASAVRLAVPVTGLLLVNERVRLVGQFAEQQQIVTAETIAVAKLLLVVQVGAGECHAIERPLIRRVLPDGGFEPAKSEGFDGCSGCCGGGAATGRR
jgi:hypothetical protein